MQNKFDYIKDFIQCYAGDAVITAANENVLQRQVVKKNFYWNHGGAPTYVILPLP